MPFVAAGLVALLVGCAPSGRDVKHDDPLVAGVDALLDRLHEQGLFDGAVVIARNDRVLYTGARGLADRESGFAFSVDTPVEGASLAKTFAAASTWELIGEGRLELETRVRDVVPSFSNEQVRVRHLLDHSAGLPELDDATGMTNEDIAAAMPKRSDFDPGRRFRYCNECFDLLALVVERAGGQPWDRFLEERFFGPLGMEHTFSRPRWLRDWPGQRARAYRRVAGGMELHDLHDDEPFYGSSNLVFSARDLDRWAAFLITVARQTEHPWRAGFERADFDGRPSSMNRLNWHAATADGPFHFNGHLRGFHHEVMWDPRTGTRLVWVSNVLGGRPVPQRLTRFLWELAEQPAAVAPPTLFDSWLGDAGAEVEATAVAGSYRLESGGLVEVVFADGDWSLVVDGTASDLYPHRPFYAPDHDVAIGFEGLENGQYGFLLWQTVFSAERARRVSLSGDWPEP